MTDRDRQRLKGVHPKLVTALEQVFTALTTLGHAMFVTEGVRTLERQKTLYAQGRTAPGILVTRCDGVKHPSNHQVKSDGLGYAVDCAFIGANPYSAAHPWATYGAELRKHGMSWGGDWDRPDRPHAELLIA